MIEVKNKKKYFPTLIKSTLLMLSGFILVLIFQQSFSWLVLILLLTIELILISTKFTQSISIKSTKIVIIYFRFLIKSRLEIQKSEVEFKLKKSASLRSPAYLILEILKKNKKVYQVDSRDGFEEEDLNLIKSSINTNL